MAIQFSNNTGQTCTYVSNDGTPYISLSGGALTGQRTIASAATSESWSDGDSIPVFIKKDNNNWAVWLAIWSASDSRLLSSGGSVEATSGTISDQSIVEVVCVASRAAFSSLGGISTLDELTDVSTQNVETGDILAYNGSNWAPASPSSLAGGRQILSENIELHVSTASGNDSNTGLSYGNALKTLTEAVRRVRYTLDLNAYSINIYLYDGTYSMNGAAFGAYVGGVHNADYEYSVNVYEDSYSSATIQTASEPIEIVSGRWYFNGVTFKTTGSGSALKVRHGAEAFLYNCEYTPGASGYHIEVDGGYLKMYSGTANTSCLGYVKAENGGKIVMDGYHTVSSRAFSVATVVAQQHGMVMCDYNINSWSGSGTTGKRYMADQLGLIYTFGGGANFISGSIAGTVSNGGIYA
jgi:hypothetical protein